MKKKLILLFCLLGMVSMEAQTKGKILMSVIVVGNIDNIEKTVVNSAFMQRLSGSKNYKVYERNSAIQSGLLEEQDYQVSGEVPEKDIRAVCKRNGVDYVTVVDVEVLDDNKCHMTARIVNVVTGEVVKSGVEMREYNGTETMQAISNRLAYRLYSQTSK